MKYDIPPPWHVPRFHFRVPQIASDGAGRLGVDFNVPWIRLSDIFRTYLESAPCRTPFANLDGSSVSTGAPCRQHKSSYADKHTACMMRLKALTLGIGPLIDVAKHTHRWYQEHSSQLSDHHNPLHTKRTHYDVFDTWIKPHQIVRPGTTQADGDDRVRYPHCLF